MDAQQQEIQETKGSLPPKDSDKPRLVRGNSLHAPQSTEDWTKNIKYSKPNIFRQTNILVWKNFKVLFGRWTLVIGHVATVAQVCIFILLLNWLVVNSVENGAVSIPKSSPVPFVGQCTFPGCKSFPYGIIGNETAKWVDYTLDYIAKKGNFERTEANMPNVLFDRNPLKLFNETKLVGMPTIVLFCTDKVLVPFLNQLIDCTDSTQFPNNGGIFNYWILYNQTLTKLGILSGPNSPFANSDVALSTKFTVDSAIANFLANPSNDPTKSEVTIELSAASFPNSPNRFFTSFDTSSAQGGFWFFIPIMVSFQSLTTEIVTEKEKELRKGLMLYGANSMAYWVSWVGVCFVISVAFGFIIWFFAWCARLEIFVRTPFPVIWLIFIPTILGYHIIGMVISACCQDSKSSTKWSYGVMLFSIFLQIFFANGMLVDLFYSDNANIWITVVAWIMYFIPAFHFSAIIAAIIPLAGTTLDPNTKSNVEGPGFTWHDFVSQKSATIFGNATTTPSPIASMFILWALCIFYLLVLWLMDNMIGSNRGFFRNPFYFIVNCFKKRSKAKPRITIPQDKQSEITNGSQKAPPQKLDRFDNGEDYSRDLLMDDYLAENTSKGGIILNKVSKCYTGTCSCTGKKFWALNYVDLDIARGEIFGLLGPNGAGKTTMIQILSGVLEPTKGSLWSWGVNREDDPTRIRNFTNVCPQFDILWAELTVRDHVKLIAWIKGIQDTDIDQFAETLLRNVNLENSLDTKIMNLSGGMRRRVSIALCTIGNPNIIIFDEPTTGLDPENRRLIWKFMNSLKTTDRSIMLTTHILEEAEILSDRIGILSRGQLVKVGTSAELKSGMGQGYKITILMNNKDMEKNIEVVKRKVAELVPESQLFAESGSNLLFQLPPSESEISQLLSYLETDPEIKGAIDDMSISNTSLEEVFIKLTGADEDNLEQARSRGVTQYDLPPELLEDTPIESGSKKHI